jgi:UDP-N-acetylglucosamine transferase subunit ALG13
MVDLAIQKRLYAFINKFSSCWVPDRVNATINAAGELSHPGQLPNTAVEYIGWLSRFKKNDRHSIENDLLIILSGPEPQRAILEQILFKELRTFHGSAVMVRGVFSNDFIPSEGKVRIINYASSSELNTLICSSGIILCRSGYTSVMDLLLLGKKGILIPTPGQAEQEYIGRHLHQKNLALTAKQTSFSLETAFESDNKITIECRS